MGHPGMNLYDDRIVESAPLIMEERRITLEARAARLRLPFGGLVWSRPAAVITRGPSTETRLPIRDLTRRAQVALYAIALLFALAGLRARGRTLWERTP